jgi:hypothetical protein
VSQNRQTEQQEAGENCVMRDFINDTHHQMYYYDDENKGVMMGVTCTIQQTREIHKKNFCQKS